MNKGMRIIKEKNIQIVHQKMEMNCEIEIATRKKNAEENYLTTPISVLKYITVLEEQAEQLRKFKKKGGDK